MCVVTQTLHAVCLQRYIEARSCKYFFSGKTIIITNSECV